jgi:hypothetical protein
MEPKLHPAGVLQLQSAFARARNTFAEIYGNGRWELDKCRRCTVFTRNGRDDGFPLDPFLERIVIDP